MSRAPDNLRPEMWTRPRALALLSLVGPAVAAVAIVAGTPSTGAQARTSHPAALAQTLARAAQELGEHAAITGVVIDGPPGSPARVLRARPGDPAGFPLSWVNPAGDEDALAAVHTWVDGAAFTPTRIGVGRRNGRGRLAWRVEGRRRGHAELWLVAPNGVLLSHRRLATPA